MTTNGYDLPDYHEVIKHPMDFATVGNNLASGRYSTLAQLEVGSFLAALMLHSMLTGFNVIMFDHKDNLIGFASAMEKGKLRPRASEKEISEVKVVVERSGKELESEQKTGSNSLAKKLLKKPISQTVQEPVGSDFSSGATLATAGDFQNGPIAVKAGGNERPANVNAFIL
ncbi:hypothetical protein RJ639_009325 [Escallonia herrerae]|uniref:Bromo domain-containing protein n=1 Tax=Escallonia herrerae TaxID=1293975 RepID=A0AA89ASL6_9ASTE|nr:hypothetical protein RJ639_009325 [Escallonia herrerae]